MHATAPYVIALVATAAAAGAIALFASSRRTPGTAPFVVLMSAVALWAAGYALELQSADLADKLLWARIEYLGIVTTPAAWLVFALRHTGRARWLSRRNLALLTLHPALVLLLIWTSDLHGLIWARVALRSNDLWSGMDITYGPVFWLHTAYSYLLLLLGTLALGRHLLSTARPYRDQAIALLVGMCAPWVGNALYLSNALPLPNLDLTPFAFTITGVALGWGLLGLHLLDLTPIAANVVVQGMSDPVITLDARDRIIGMNPAARRLLGAKDRALLGRPIVERIATWPTLADYPTGAATVLTDIALAADRSFDLRISPLLDQRQRPIGRVAVLHDISEHKRLEAMLRQSERNYRALVQHMPNVTLFLFDRDLRYLLVEGAAPEQHGYHKTLMEGRTLWEALPADLAELVEPHARAALAGEVRSVGLTRDSRAYVIQFVPVRDAQSEVVAGMAVAEDVTQRRRVEASVRDQKELFENLVAVARATAEGPTLEVTLRGALAVAARLTGAAQGSLFLCNAAGVVTQSILARGEVSLERRRAVVGQVFDKGLAGWVARERQTAVVADTMSDERWIQLPDAPYVARSAIAVPIVSGPALVGVITLHHQAPGHFTERHARFMQGAADQIALALLNAQLYDELYEAKEIAEAASRAKSEFVSFVSHELKTPMSAIRGFVDLLALGMMGQVSAAQREGLAVIQSNVEMMAALVADLADVARIESGHLSMELDAIELHAIVDRVQRSLEAQIVAKGQTLSTEVPADLPPAWADHMRLAQILTNLVGNACKYTPPGGRIVVRAALVPGGAGGADALAIAVEDTGIGMRPEDQARLFEKFFRSADEQARAAPGTGLGLHITKSLVELQGGQIWCESLYRAGTTFYFTIPAATLAAQSAAGPVMV